MPPVEDPPRVIRFAAYEADLRTGELRKQGTRLKIEQQPFRVLTMLLEHPGDLVTREELKATLWSSDTFVDFDSSLNTDIAKLREVLGDSAANPRFVETIPRRGYRFIAPVEPPHKPLPRRKGRLLVPAAVAALVLIAAAVFFYARPRAPVLTEKDEILLADFVNTTGEPIFDGALKAAVAVKLGESPFLNTVSDTRIRDTLMLMQKPAEEKLVGAVAREACQRLNVKAVLSSSIARLGSEYVITLEALNCQTGERLALEQAEAPSQAEVLKSLGQATTKLRKKLGESVKSIKAFDTPLYEATTSSLEALKSYSLGMQQQNRGRYPEAIGFYQHAVELDPKFAIAYQRLATCYRNMGQIDHARPYYSKAFELRQRASERERYQISALFYRNVTGELHKAITIYQVYEKSYPRDGAATSNLGVIYNFDLGWADKALVEARKSFDLGQTSSANYANLAACLTSLGRYEEATAVLQEGERIHRGAWMPYYHWLYALAFVRGDSTGMEEFAAKSKGTADEGYMLNQRAGVKAFGGQMRQARELYRQRVRLALAANQRELAETDLNAQAWLEAEMGNVVDARAILPEPRTWPTAAGLARARIGNVAGAQRVADELAKRFPLGTVAQEIDIPLIRAAIALERGDGAGALEALRPAAPYELSGHEVLYFRGYAHLQSGAAAEAATDFQKILDHRGINVTATLYPLAYVGLARARTLAGDSAGALKAYEQFFTIWKDADSDIPILRQAKAEYAKLNQAK